MTSREVTSYLPRATAGDAQPPVGLRDRLVVLAFLPLQLPWLAYSLWGGRRRDKAALLARLDLPPDALPNLGSWKADTGLLHLIVDQIETQRPQSVVELGAGASTLVTARALHLFGGGRLTSYDQHADFLEATRAWLAEHGLTVDLRAVPLARPPRPWRGLWYALSDVPEAIDLLLIDGPQWTLHPFVRGAAETLFDRITAGGVVMLDDAARPGERVIARRWRQRWPKLSWRFVPGIKGTLVGTRRY